MTGAAEGAKRRGVTGERDVVRFLRARGYEAVRSAGSHSRADITTSCRIDHVPYTIGLEVKCTKRKPRPGDFFPRPQPSIRLPWEIMGVWWPPGVKIEDAQVFDLLFWPRSCGTLSHLWPHRDADNVRYEVEYILEGE